MINWYFVLWFGSGYALGMIITTWLFYVMVTKNIGAGRDGN